MIIRWTEKAFLSLQQITQHIARDNSEAATLTAQNIYARIEDPGYFSEALANCWS